jgi:hypothetical protein
MGIAAGQYSSMACERGGHAPSRYSTSGGKSKGSHVLCRQMAPVRGKGSKTIDLKTSLCAADECVEPKGYMNESDSLLLHHAANR